MENFVCVFVGFFGRTLKKLQTGLQIDLSSFKFVLFKAFFFLVTIKFIRLSCMVD